MVLHILPPWTQHRSLCALQEIKGQQKKSKKAKQRARKAAANQSVNGQQTEVHAAVPASDTTLRTTQVTLKCRNGC